MNEIVATEVSFKCHPSGPCVRCKDDERSDEVCATTGYHQAITCVPDLHALRSEEVSKIDVEKKSAGHAWQACTQESYSGTTGLLAFQGTCAFVGMIAGYIVYRKRNTRGI